MQQYLSTHLRRYHKLDNQSSQYKTAISVARPYEGINRELRWDALLHQNKKKKQAESDDSDLEPSAEPQERDNHPLQVLVNELPSTDSDDDYRPPMDEQDLQDSEDVIPPSPAASKCRSLRADGNDRKQNEKKTNEKEDEGSEIVEEESSEIHQEDEEEDADDENKTDKEGDEDNEQEDWSESDQDEEPEKFATLKEFYQLEKGANAFHTLLVMFFCHLQT